MTDGELQSVPSFYRVLSDAFNRILPRVPALFLLILPYAILDALLEWVPEMAPISIKLLAVLMITLAYILFSAALTVAIDCALEENRSQSGIGSGFIGNAFGRTLARFGDLFWVQVQIFVGCIWRVLLFIIPVFPYLTRVLFASVTVVLAKEGDGRDAFEVSDKLTRGIRWRLFGAMILMLMPTLLMLLQRSFFADRVSPWFYLLLTIPVNALVMILWHILLVALYRFRTRL